ncbi:MAG: hypothetical protein L0387_02375 [Acidobacteria bacterium]|nr:hypothetical protein [Acidobacteriota bacterium]
MSDNELFAVLLGALALALLLRRFTAAHASKIGLASANAAIAAVAAAVLGGLLIKFFRGSIIKLPAVVLVIGGLVAMGIGLAVSLISTLRALALGVNPKFENASVATDRHNVAPPKAENDDSSDLNHLEFLWMQNAQRGQPNTWEPIEHSNRDLMDDFQSGPKENY